MEGQFVVNTRPNITQLIKQQLYFIQETYRATSKVVEIIDRAE